MYITKEGYNIKQEDEKKDIFSLQYYFNYFLK